ncbi:MAG: DUF11 domain-containing protein, partial [Candidatus Pacebacteria bacterium]|nr:DUF11 domain-containing protein [Candidatus Paceibacterota bacterium]
ITLIKQANKTQVSSGDEITFTITYKNLGTGTANNLVITDPIPTGLSYVAGSGTVSPTFINNILTWTIASVGANSSGSVSFRVKVD